MANQTPIIKEDITVKSLLGKKTTSGGKDFWQIDTDKGKYRIWDREVFEGLIIGNNYKCDIQEYGGTFTNDKGESIDYKLKTIINVITGNLQSTTSTMQPVSEIKPDWDAIAEGKVRHGVIVAEIEHGGLFDLTDENLDQIEILVNYIMKGRK